MPDASATPAHDASVLADTTLVIAPRERRNAVLEIIRSATRRLSLSIFRCDDDAILVELEAAATRGVQVDILLTPRAKGDRSELERLAERLTRAGIAAHQYPHALTKYHAKYVVADGVRSLIGTFSMTARCFTETCDFGVCSTDPPLAAGLLRLFDADRDGLATPLTLPPALIVGPEQSRQRMLDLFTKAAGRIRVLDPKLSDPQISSVLRGAAARGVSVELVSARFIGELRSHGKLVIVDDVAVIGSGSLAARHLDHRRELAIVIDDPATVDLCDSFWGRTVQGLAERLPFRHTRGEAPRSRVRQAPRIQPAVA